MGQICELKVTFTIVISLGGRKRQEVRKMRGRERRRERDTKHKSQEKTDISCLESHRRREVF